MDRKDYNRITEILLQFPNAGADWPIMVMKYKEIEILERINQNLYYISRSLMEIEQPAIKAIRDSLSSGIPTDPENLKD